MNPLVYFLIGIILSVIYNSYRFAKRRYNSNYLENKYGVNSKYSITREAGKGLPNLIELAIYSNNDTPQLFSGAVSVVGLIIFWPVVLLFLAIYLGIDYLVRPKQSEGK